MHFIICRNRLGFLRGCFLVILNKYSFLIGFLCASFPMAEAKSYLWQGERLYVGEYLTSENKRFQMGFNELGELEIIDLIPTKSPDLNLIREFGWDGKTFWKAREGKSFIPQQNSIPYPGSPSHYGDMMFKIKDIKFKRETVPMRNFGIWDTSYLTLEATGNLVIYTKSLITQFDPPVPRQRWTQNLAFSCQAIRKNEEPILLHLENSGRAFVLCSSGALLWCSCPYCENNPDNGTLMTDLDRAIRVDGLIYGSYARAVNILAMPKHPEVAKNNNNLKSSPGKSNADATNSCICSSTSSSTSSTITYEKNDNYKEVFERIKALKFAN